MKTIEIAVRITAQVSEEIAEDIAKNNEKFWLDFPFKELKLQNGQKGAVEADFYEYETMNITDLSE